MATPLPPASVEIRGLSKRFGENANVVDRLDLDIRPGEFFSLLGPSGCGKTTLLRMLAGFESPTEGFIRIGGDDVTQLPVHRRDIGMVFQSYALFPHRTVAENVGFGLRMRGVPHAEAARRVGEALALVKLSTLENRRPSELSGGQQQRVALARAVVTRPRLLLCDEPLGALDRKLRQTLQIELRQLQRTLGVTLVFVTHDQEEALAMSDRIGVMHAGRLEQVDSPQAIYQQPRTRFVAGFIGDINLFSGLQKNIACMANGGEQLYERAVSATSEIAIRPERCRLLEPANGMMAGTVRRTTFLGDYVQYAVDVPSHGEVLVKLAARGSALYAEGDQVGISWDTADAVELAT